MKVPKLSNKPYYHRPTGFYIPMKARYEGISGIKVYPSMWTLNFEVDKEKLQ